MVIETKDGLEGLDTEWLELILEARKLGLEKEEIREFLENHSSKQASP